MTPTDTLETELQAFHVYPLNDLREHEISDKPCWCKPRIEDGIVIHNSMDGREDYETGKRRPS